MHERICTYVARWNRESRLWNTKRWAIISNAERYTNAITQICGSRQLPIIKCNTNDNCITHKIYLRQTKKRMRITALNTELSLTTFVTLFVRLISCYYTENISKWSYSSKNPSWLSVDAFWNFWHSISTRNAYSMNKENEIYVKKSALQNEIATEHEATSNDFGR